MQLLWKQIFTHDPNEQMKTMQKIERLEQHYRITTSEELKQDCFLTPSGHGGEVYDATKENLLTLMPVNLLLLLDVVLTFTLRIREDIVVCLK